jgi:hypothetical protein
LLSRSNVVEAEAELFYGQSRGPGDTSPAQVVIVKPLNSNDGKKKAKKEKKKQKKQNQGRGQEQLGDGDSEAANKNGGRESSRRSNSAHSLSDAEEADTSGI